jgi:hypothetical protein
MEQPQRFENPAAVVAAPVPTSSVPAPANAAELSIQERRRIKREKRALRRGEWGRGMG